MKQNINVPVDSEGVHITADLQGCAFDILNNKEFLLQLLEDAARLTEAKILHSYAHKFEPFGVTCIVIINSSHLSLHSWPENGFCAIDVYTCNEGMWPEKALDLILEVLDPLKSNVSKIARGFTPSENER